MKNHPFLKYLLITFLLMIVLCIADLKFSQQEAVIERIMRVGLFGGNTHVVWPGQSIQQKINYASTLSSEASPQTVWLFAARYEGFITIDANAANNFEYITLMGSSWSIFQTEIWADDNTPGNITNQGVITIGQNTIAGIIDNVTFVDLTVANFGNGSPDPAIGIDYGDASRKAIGTIEYNNCDLVGLHDGYQLMAGPDNASDISTHIFRGCTIKSRWDSWAAKGSGIFEIYDSEIIADYSLYPSLFADDDHKFTGVHFNSGKGSANNLTTCRFYIKNSKITVHGATSKQDTGTTHNHCSGILLYNGGQHLPLLEIVDTDIDVDYTVDDTTDCSAIPVCGILYDDGDDASSTTTAITMINSRITVDGLTDSTYAPTNVYGVFFDGDSTLDATVNGTFHRNIITTSNAKTGGSDKALDFNNGDSASVKIWTSLETDDTIDGTVTFDDGHLP